MSSFFIIALTLMWNVSSMAFQGPQEIPEVKSYYSYSGIAEVEVYAHVIAVRPLESAQTDALNKVLSLRGALVAQLPVGLAEGFKSRGFAFYRLKERASRALIAELATLEVQSGIPVVLDNGSLQLSNETFVAAVKPGVSLEEIEKLNQEFGVDILRRHGLYDIFSPNRQAKGDSIDLSKIYMESGLFKYAEPQLIEIMEGRPAFSGSN